MDLHGAVELMPTGDVSGGLWTEAVASGWECVQQLGELSILGVEDVRGELNNLETGKLVAEVEGPSKLYLVGSGRELGRVVVTLEEGGLGPVAAAWELEQS